MKGSGYTAFVKSFAVFASDVELDPSRIAKHTKPLKAITELKQLEELGMPIKNVFNEPSTNTTIVEFDLSRRACL